MTVDRSQTRDGSLKCGPSKVWAGSSVTNKFEKKADLPYFYFIDSVLCVDNNIFVRIYMCSDVTVLLYTLVNQHYYP